MLPPSKQGT